MKTGIIRSHIRPLLHLGVMSFLLLFLELLLIRLIGTEIRIFAYLSNLVLLAVFLGSGVGMFLKRPIPLHVSILSLTLVTGATVAGLFTAITGYVTPLSSSAVWYAPTAVPAALTAIGVFQIAALFMLVILIFAPLGQKIGGYFSDTKHTVLYYSANLVCSVLGIWGFYLVSAFRVSPYAGIFVSECILLLLTLRGRRLLSALCVVATGITLLLSRPSSYTVWSPYQKLSVIPEVYDDVIGMQKTITVNNVGYMSLLDLSEPNAARMRQTLRASGKVPETELIFQNLYDLPYRIMPQAEDVLILGAGGGNDAAAAIRAGVASIDAVEIDPAIIDLGNRFHPERPLADPRVRVTVDDGRAYVRRTLKRYDIVIMGFTDSHTTNSTLTNIQLDNYLYTLESFREIARILKPGGMLFISIDVIQPWIGSHIRSTLSRAFGSVPVSAYMDSYMTGGGTVFLVANDMRAVRRNISRVPGLSSYLSSHARPYPATDVLTDDWPYLYLKSRSVPVLHLLIAAILISIVLAAGKRIGLYAGFMPVPFLLGAAFLLYEFQNVTKTSLLYGNTWVTNAYTITGVLLFSLLANLAYVRLRIGNRVLYLLLIASLIAELLVPTALFAAFSLPVRIASATLFLNLPVFFSGWIFVSVLSGAKNKRAALASNFLGSFAGGITSFLSYVWGLKSLLLTVVALYAVSFILSGARRPRGRDL